MRILLPPSEGKTAPDAGEPVDIGELFAPELNDTRKGVAEALAKWCATDPDNAASELKLGKQLRHYLDVDQRIWDGPTVAAANLYTGVLFDALAFGELSPRAWQRARDGVLIFSGLWGAVRPTDRLPDYRCPAGARVPGLRGEGPVAVNSHWRNDAGEVLCQILADQFILDLRSQDYQAMWRPKSPHATVRVLHERVVYGELTRGVVGHFNKATKGRLTADLLAADVDVQSVSELTEALRDLKYRVEIDSAHPNRVDIITTQL